MISAAILHFINHISKNQIEALNLPSIIKTYILYLHYLALPVLILYDLSGIAWIILSWIKQVNKLNPE